MQWKDRVSLLAPNYTEHVVNDTVEHFWPISTANAAKLAKLGGPVIDALTVVFSGDQDNAVTKRSFKADGGTDGEEHITEAISPELAAMRASQRSEAFSKALGVLASREGLEVAENLIKDSMREWFPRDERRDWPASPELVNTVPVTVFREMLMGVLHANLAVLGPFAQKVQEVLTKATEVALATSLSTSTEEPSYS